MGRNTWIETGLRRGAVLTAVAVSLGLAGQGRSAGTASGAVVPVFVFAGQSNAVGASTSPAELPVGSPFLGPQQNVLFYGPTDDVATTWGPLTAPTETTQAVTGPEGVEGFGPEISTGRAISLGQLGGATVAEVKLAVNGTNLQDDWNPYNPAGLYPRLVNRVTTGLEQLPIQQPGMTGQVAGFFFMQGESDSYALDRANGYQQHLANLICKIRQDFGVPNLPIVLGQIGNAGYLQTTVREAQLTIARLDPYVRLARTDDLARSSGGDQIHFNTQGIVDLGERFAQMYADIGGSDTDNIAFNGGFEGSATTSLVGTVGDRNTSAGDGIAGRGFVRYWDDFGAGVTLMRSGTYGTGTSMASEGTQWVSLVNHLYNSATGPGGLRQTFATTPGQVYQLEFDYSAMASGDPLGPLAYAFSFDLGPGYEVPGELVVSTEGLAAYFMAGWERRVYQFVAVGDSVTVTFQYDGGVNNGELFGPGIDNVRLAPGSRQPVIPEPGAAVGLVGAVWMGLGRTRGRQVRDR